METERNPWERLDGEPHLWFARFEAFRLSGPGRSVLGTVNRDRDRRGQKRTSNIPQSWRAAVIKWAWRERAQAWDLWAAEQAEARWMTSLMGKAEVLGRMSEHGRNDLREFFKISERWSEHPLPSEEVIGEEEYIKDIIEGVEIKAVRYLVRGVVLDADALIDPARSWRVKKFADSPKNGLAIELHDVGAALGNMARHWGLLVDRAANLNVDLSQLSNEQLERIANGEDPVHVLAAAGKG